jgi:hypothetical protein
LDDAGILEIDNDDQTGACSQHGLFLILPPPILVQLRSSSGRMKINREDFRKLVNTKRTSSHRQAL